MKMILLIEDDNDIRENTCELLELEGYKVILALNGKSGLMLALEHPPDVVLCDIMMLQADGYEVFKGLQADPCTRSIPFIFLTASAENKEMAAGLAMGASGYIPKPFDSEELFQTIKQCLSESTFKPMVNAMGSLFCKTRARILCCGQVFLRIRLTQEKALKVILSS